jgi:hypothetical protein
VILLVTMLLASILCSGFENGESHGQLCFVIWKQEKKNSIINIHIVISRIQYYYHPILWHDFSANRENDS